MNPLSKIRSAFPACILFAGSFQILGAAIVARFDVGDTTASSVQSTFASIGAAGTNPAAYAGPQTATSGSITLRLVGGTTLANATTKDGSGNFNSTGSLVSRNRNTPGADTGTFTYSDIYRDFVTANVLGIQLSGLAASSNYAITFYVYDNSGNRTQTYTDVTVGGWGFNGAVTYTAAAPFSASTSNEVFATTVTAHSDSNGRLFFTGTGVGTTNVGLIGGLVVDAIPEPSASFILLGAAGLMGFRRRR